MFERGSLFIDKPLPKFTMTGQPMRLCYWHPDYQPETQYASASKIGDLVIFPYESPESTIFDEFVSFEEIQLSFKLAQIELNEAETAPPSGDGSASFGAVLDSLKPSKTICNVYNIANSCGRPHKSTKKTTISGLNRSDFLTR